MPGTMPCHTPASYSSSSNLVSVPSSSKTHTSTDSATVEATAKFTPSSPTVAPRWVRLPGRALRVRVMRHSPVIPRVEQVVDQVHGLRHRPVTAADHVRDQPGPPRLVARAEPGRV